MTAPTKGAIRTGYRVRGSWAAGYHTGVDYPVPTGTRVNAPAASTIVHTGAAGGWGRAYGTHVIGETVVNGVRYRWIVAHLSAVRVHKGQHVAAGQLVGLSGNTGRTTGPHVHFEVRTAPFRYGSDVHPGGLINHKAGPVDRMDPANYGPGHVGAHITWLGKRLIAHGFARHYQHGPGPVWGPADQLNVRDFQRAQGWTGTDADGLPGARSLVLLAADPPKQHTPTPRKGDTPK